MIYDEEGSLKEDVNWKAYYPVQMSSDRRLLAYVEWVYVFPNGDFSFFGMGNFVTSPYTVRFQQ
jgi:hypothetical protein